MLFPNHADPEKLNLLCFPYAGGNADFYNRWKSKAHDEVVIHPLQLPGRGQHINLPLISSMHFLIELLANEIHRFRNCRLALLGTSMGGWVAYQLAQHLKQLGNLLKPECLIICSTAHPKFRTHLPQIDNIDTNSAIKRLGKFNPSCLRTLQNSELASLFLPILQADFTLCRNWKFNENLKIDCPIFAFHGNHDHIVDHSMMRPWQSLTSGDFFLTSIDGDHFFTEHPPAAFFEQLSYLLHAPARQPVVSH